MATSSLSGLEDPWGHLSSRAPAQCRIHEGWPVFAFMSNRGTVFPLLLIQSSHMYASLLKLMSTVSE